MQGFDVRDFLSYLDNAYLLQGVVTTIWLTIVPMAGGLLLGFLLASLRLSANPGGVWFARGYVWIFRGTPLLIQLVIVYTGLPQIGLKLGVIASALLALTLNETAYFSEIIRGGFLGVSQGQRDAAMALGLPRWLVTLKIVLPQALRLIIPALGNSINGLLKATSITSVISMEEIMRRSQTLMQLKFDVLEVYAAAAVYYLLLTTLWDLAQRRLEARFNRGYGDEVEARAAPVQPLVAEPGY